MEEYLKEKQPLPQHLQLDQYKVSDFQEIQDLERSAAHKWGRYFPFNRMKACMKFNSEYSVKAQLFQEYFIPIIRDNNTKKIIAIISCVTKNANLDKKIMKMGYLYDLRIHEKYQGMGLGKFILSVGDQ